MTTELQELGGLEEEAMKDPGEFLSREPPLEYCWLWGTLGRRGLDPSLAKRQGAVSVPWLWLREARQGKVIPRDTQILTPSGESQLSPSLFPPPILPTICTGYVHIKEKKWSQG